MACNAARDRNSPTTAHQISLQKSPIAPTINRFAVGPSVVLDLRWGQGLFLKKVSLELLMRERAAIPINER